MRGYSVGGIEVAFMPMDAPEVHNPRAGDMHYEGLNEGTSILKKGHVKKEGALPLPCDMIYERDVPVALRDGVRIRVDVYRPVDSDSKPVPAIAAWSPYGKSGVGFPNLEYLPFRAGIPEVSLSGYEKFEGPDPAVLVAHGYAAINADQRGVWDSEGDFVWNSSQEGRDGADFIEWVGTQKWCSGKVGMAGNSWLTQAMWHIAAERPPHLTAIAPWEGHSDFYRETWARGGVPTGGFWEFLSSWLRGRGRKEDVRTMLDKYGTLNAYWEDKCAKLERINIPAYILASYSTGLHTYGSCRAYREIDCKDKWLRFHPFQEWFDLYQPQNVRDMIKFFDHYLKGEDNGWQQTPRVRLSLIGMGEHAPIINRAESDYPLPHTDYRKFHLHCSSGKLASESASQEAQVSYRADVLDKEPDDRAEFTHVFDRYTEIAGYAKLRVFVSCKEHDDLDLFVQLRKLDRQGQEMSQINYPLKVLQEMAGVKTESDVPWFNIVRHLGPTGMLRASHRTLDSKRATDFDPQNDSSREEKIPPGDVVAVEIPFWPCGMFFESGESLKLIVSGHALQLKEFPEIVERNLNKGRHVLHSGGRYVSFLQAPIIKEGK